MKKFIYSASLILGVLLTVSPMAFSALSASRPVSYLPWNDVTSLDRDWLYLNASPKGMPDSAKDTDYTPVTLPHTWNALDSLETKNYRRDASWYRRKLDVSAEDLKGRLYIRFGAAGQQAEVFVNGVKRLTHKGGYTAFTLELTDFVKPGSNQIDVMVSNKHDASLVPLSGDFTFYGGLYRSVNLLRGPLTGISRTDHAGPGVKVWSRKVSDRQAVLASSVMLDHRGKKSKKVMVKLTLEDSKGRVCGTSHVQVCVKPGDAQSVSLPPVTLQRPLLWSPEHPQLYTVKISVVDALGEKLDESTVSHGFRWYQFTADRGFFLNGKPYVLNGVNRHQDCFQQGNALSLAQHERDIRQIKETGANWLRLAHYTQHDYVLDLCDQLGILVWEENPWVNGTTYTPDFLKNMKSMITEMIHQHFNHASTVVWGISNEVWLNKGPDGKAKQLPIYQELNNLVHQLDPQRVTGVVSGDTNSYSDLGVMDIPDVIGYNLYCGWYGRKPADFKKRATQLHQKNPDKPMLITEYGAGSDMRIHTLTPKSQDFSEEWQVLFFESYQKQAKQMPWLSGMTRWAMADFGSANRGDSIPHVNQKGLVTFDRKEKDVFYSAKALWSQDPVLRIQSTAWTKRSGDPEQKIRVISNMDSVEFFFQGKSIGEQTSNFIWPVHFKEGKNELRAVGKTGDIRKDQKMTVIWKKHTQRFKVSASKSQSGHPAAHMADEQSFTRWASNGPATVDLDLNHPVLIDGVTFQFYLGTKRRYKLDISLSSDGKNYKQVFSGESKGKKATESILFDQVEARYIRIKAKGNNESSWNSWSEVSPIISTDKKHKNRYEIIGEGDVGKGGVKP